MHFWPMLGTHSYTPWISIFSISLFLYQSPLLLVFVQMWMKLIVLDHLFTLLLEVVLSSLMNMIPIDTDWIFIFYFGFYIQLMTTFSSWFRLCTYNLSCFPFITSFHFIFHNFAPFCFFTFVFSSSLLIWKLLLCYPSSSSPMTSFISFLVVLFPSFLGLPNSLIPLFLGFLNSFFAFIKWLGCNL